MRKAKDEAGTTKKPVAGRTGRRPVKRAGTGSVSARKKVGVRAPRVLKPASEGEASVAAAQSTVVASKFGTEIEAPRQAPRPTLPSSYGESHLLLLVRDPQSLFAAWDLSPSTIQSLKTRLGARAFAVSTLTLRLTRAGGGTTVVHAAKKARSRYLKIDGGPSYMAEIGFTTPTGRFEFVARSAPCFVPLGPARLETEIARRAVLSYQEARTLTRQAAKGAPSMLAAAGQARAAAPSGGGVPRSSAAPAPARVLGGASDLYRR